MVWKRCVCIYGRLTCWFSRQANTPPPSGGFFHSFGHKWPRHQFGKMCVCSTFYWDPWSQDFFGDWRGPDGRSRRQNQKLPTPSGYQATLKPLTDLLKGGAKMLVDRFSTGGIPKCYKSPGGGGAPPTSCPKCWAFFSHWCLRYTYQSSHTTKTKRPFATTWFLFLQTHRHGIPLLYFRSWIIGCPCSNQTFPLFLRRSSFSTLDRS